MKSIAAKADVQMIAVDLAKEVFQLVCADANFRIVQSLRLKRAWVVSRLGGVDIHPADKSEPILRPI